MPNGRAGKAAPKPLQRRQQQRPPMPPALGNLLLLVGLGERARAITCRYCNKWNSPTTTTTTTATMTTATTATSPPTPPPPPPPTKTAPTLKTATPKPSVAEDCLGAPILRTSNNSSSSSGSNCNKAAQKQQTNTAATIATKATSQQWPMATTSPTTITRANESGKSCCAQAKPERKESRIGKQKKISNQLRRLRLLRLSIDKNAVANQLPPSQLVVSESPLAQNNNNRGPYQRGRREQEMMLHRGLTRRWHFAGDSNSNDNNQSVKTKTSQAPANMLSASGGQHLCRKDYPLKRTKTQTGRRRRRDLSNVDSTRCNILISTSSAQTYKTTARQQTNTTSNLFREHLINLFMNTHKRISHNTGNRKQSSSVSSSLGLLINMQVMLTIIYTITLFVISPQFISQATATTSYWPSLSATSTNRWPSFGSQQHQTETSSALVLRRQQSPTNGQASHHRRFVESLQQSFAAAAAASAAAAATASAALARRDPKHAQNNLLIGQHYSNISSSIIPYSIVQDVDYGLMQDDSQTIGSPSKNGIQEESDDVIGSQTYQPQQFDKNEQLSDMNNNNDVISRVQQQQQQQQQEVGTAPQNGVIVATASDRALLPGLDSGRLLLPQMQQIKSRFNQGCVGGTKCQFFAFCWMSGGSLGASCGLLMTCCVTPSRQEIQPGFYGPVVNDPCKLQIVTPYS